MRGHKWSTYRRPGSGDVWQVIFRIGGRRCRRSTGETDHAAAETRAGEIWLKERARAGQPVQAEEAAVARLTTERAAAEWTDHLEQHAAEHREQFVKRHEADLNLYIVPAWTYVDEITSAAWETRKLELHKGNGGPLGWRSIQHLAVTLRGLLRHCLSIGAIENVPELQPPPNRLVRQEQAPRRAYTHKERETFLSAIRKPYPRSWRFYTVLFFSLMRKGELFGLRASWIDFRRERIVIPATDSKSGHEEEIHLHPRAAAALKAEMASKQRGRTPDARDPPLFGKHDARAAWRYGLTTAGIDPAGLVPHHSTRHTGATMAGEKTTDILELLAAGRWKSIDVAKKYLHVDAKRAKRVMRKL